MTDLSISPTLSHSLPTMRTISDALTGESKKTRRRFEFATATVSNFHASVGPIALSSVSQSSVRDYSKSLVAAGLSMTDVCAHLLALSSVVRSAKARGYLPPWTQCPFERSAEAAFTSMFPSSNLRPLESFSRLGLITSFLERCRFDPRRSHASRLWAPLLALFMGLRPREIDGARASSIQLLRGSWVLRVPRTRCLDTAVPGSRLVPIHPELISCGLLAHAARIKSSGGDQLLVPEGNDGVAVWPSSPTLTTWYEVIANYMRLPEPLTSLESLRSMFIVACLQAGMKWSNCSKVMGWSFRGGHGTSPVSLRAALPDQSGEGAVTLMDVGFDELDLRRFYVEHPWKGVIEAFEEREVAQ